MEYARFNITMRHSIRRGDPANGISINGINESWHASRHLWSFDIARTPLLVSNDLEFIDIHAEATKVNSCRFFVDKKKRHLQRGRI